VLFFVFEGGVVQIWADSFVGSFIFYFYFFSGVVMRADLRGGAVPVGLGSV
jgi:hypothetical protein